MHQQYQEILLPKHFIIDLFELGDFSSCLYSFLCGRCAIADSRARLDSSSYYFNLLGLDLTTYRWLVRSSYGIGSTDTYFEDSMLSYFCSCCVINQIYQTTLVFGNPTPDGGSQHNLNPMLVEVNDSYYWQNFAMAMCCGRYVRAHLLYDAMGMPFWLGCCNVSPCLARNLIRYQFRLMPDSDNDLVEECLLPALYDGCFSLFCPWFSFFGNGCLLANDLVILQEEVSQRYQVGPKRYLSMEQYTEYDRPVTMVSQRY